MVSVLGGVFGAPGSWSRSTVLWAMCAAVGVVGGSLPAVADDARAPEESTEVEGLSVDPVPAAGSVDGEAGGEWLTAPDLVTAAVVAQLEGVAVEAVGERSEFGSVFAMPDGTVASSSHAGPVWVHRGGPVDDVDSWAEVDLTLRTDRDGMVRAEAHPGELTVSGGTPAGWGAGELVEVASMQTLAGPVSLGWQGPLPAPRLEGARAVYVDVVAGVDMVIDAKSTGFEQFFVVREAPVEPLSLPVVVVADEAEVLAQGGDLEVVAGDGEVLGRVPEPVMWDATADIERVHPVSEPWQEVPATLVRTPPVQWQAAAGVAGAAADRVPGVAAEGGAGTALVPGAVPPVLGADEQVVVERSVEVLGDGVAVVELTPQAEFLSDPGTVYPVVIDPELEINAGFDTYVQTGVGEDRSSADELRIGTWDGGANVARTYVNFPIGGLHGKQVLAAWMSLYEFHSFSCSARPWTVWETAPASTATRWSSQPAWVAHRAGAWETRGYSSACPPGEVGVDVTALAQTWASSGAAWAGVGIFAGDEADSHGWKRFYSAQVGLPPVVWVITNDAPVAPVALGFQPVGTVHGGVRYLKTRTPELTATVADPESAAMTAVFEVYRGGTRVAAGTVSAVTSNSVAKWRVPAGVLVEGQSYTFRVAARDPHGLQGSWSTSGSFAVDTTAPGAPTVTSTAYPKDGTWNGGAGVAGAFTLTPVAGDSSLVSYKWGLDKEPDTLVTAGAGSTTLQVTPPTNGPHVLQIQAVDRAGNASAVVKYPFNVGRAGLVSPADGSRVVRRVRLDVTAQPAYTHVRYQWARHVEGGILDIPLAHLRRSDGSALTSTFSPLPSGHDYVTWDAGAMLGRAAGPVNVRVIVAKDAAGTGQYVSPWVKVTVDPDASGAASTGVGPMSVNLLTGDGRLSATDVEEFGLSVVRTHSSRQTDSGWQPQQELLSVQQRDASAIGGFTPVGTALATVSTEQARSGRSSLKLVPSAGGTSADTFVAVGGDTGAMRLGMKAGRTYRVTGWIFVPAATGLSPVSARGLRLVVFTKEGGSYSNPTAVGAVTARPMVVGAWQELSVDVTIPAGATEAFLRLYNGFPQGSAKAVYFDDLSVRELWAPLGPQWALGGVDAASGTAFTRISTPEPDLAVVEVTGGGQIWFTSADGSTWWPEPGAEALTLERTSTNSWTLSDVEGTVTTFARGEKDTDFPVADTAPPVAQGLARYVYREDVSGISRLHKIIAPVEQGVDGWPGNAQACLGTVPARGCEVLEFTYTGTGGGRVSRISAWSTNPGVDSATSKVDVAAFEYDTAGRLTKAWDPRLGGVASTYAYDGAGRLVSMTPPGTVPWTFGYGPGGAKISGSGDLIDISAGRLLSVSRASLVPGSASELGPVNTTTVVYDVPLSRAAGGPYDLTGPAVATWGQRQAPTDATAVFGPQHVPAVTTATATVPGCDGYAPASVHYLDSSGWEVNLASPSAAGTPPAGFIDTAEYDRHGNVIRTLDASNRLLALGLSDGAAEALAGLGLSGLTSAQAALALDTRRVFFEGGIDLQAERGPVQRLAVAGDANNVQALHPVTRYRYDQGAPDGADYHLVTTTNVGSLPTSADLVTAALLDNVVTTHVYHPIDGASALGRTSGWVHRQPTRVTVDYGQPTATVAQVRYCPASSRWQAFGLGKVGDEGVGEAEVDVEWSVPVSRVRLSGRARCLRA